MDVTRTKPGVQGGDVKPTLGCESKTSLRRTGGRFADAVHTEMAPLVADSLHPVALRDESAMGKLSTVVALLAVPAFFISGAVLGFIALDTLTGTGGWQDTPIRNELVLVGVFVSSCICLCASALLGQRQNKYNIAGPETYTSGYSNHADAYKNSAGVESMQASDYPAASGASWTSNAGMSDRQFERAREQQLQEK